MLVPTCSIVGFTLSFFERCPTTIDIVTALTTIHRKVKLQINIQVVTCEKMMSEGLSLIPRGLGTRLMKPSGEFFQGFPALEHEYVYAHLQFGACT